MRVLAQARTYHNIALAQLRAGVPFVAVYFEGIDMMGHGFQHFLPPKMSFVSDADFARFHDAVPNFYAWEDERLGELLRAAGNSTVTMILSDHGFRTGGDRPNFSPSTRGQPEEWHRDWGIVVLHGPGVGVDPASTFEHFRHRADLALCRRPSARRRHARPAHRLGVRPSIARTSCPVANEVVRARGLPVGTRQAP